jgi:hypothetical protein
MKAYLWHYANFTEEIWADDAVEKVTSDFNGEYSRAPEFTWVSSLAAQLDCDFLNQLGVNVGQPFCKFSVEGLTGGAFAVACASHPAPRQNRQD